MTRFCNCLFSRPRVGEDRRCGTPEPHTQRKKPPCPSARHGQRSVRHKRKRRHDAALFQHIQCKIQNRDLRQKRKQHADARKQRTQKSSRHLSTRALPPPKQASRPTRSAMRVSHPVFQKRSGHMCTERKEKHRKHDHDKQRQGKARIV